MPYVQVKTKDGLLFNFGWWGHISDALAALPIGLEISNTRTTSPWTNDDYSDSLGTKIGSKGPEDPSDVVDPDFGEAYPRAAFLRGQEKRLGSRGDVASGFRQFLEKQFDPYLGAYTGANLVGSLRGGYPGGIDPDQTLEQFTAATPYSQLGSTAAKTWESLRSMPRSSFTLGPQFVEPVRAAEAVDPINLAKAALRSRVNPLVTRFQNTDPYDLFNAYAAQRGAAALGTDSPGNNFLDFLRTRLGLGTVGLA